MKLTKQKLISFIKIVSSWIIILFVFVLGLEFSYRNYFFDFFSNVFVANNKSLEPTNAKTLLIFGDSFSSHPLGYQKFIADSTPLHVVNYAISGTSILEHSYFANKKIEKHNPEIVIFQLYLGNDLIDIKPPINWNQVSKARNIYYSIYQQFSVVKYVNFQFGQIGASILKPDIAQRIMNDTIFATNKYSDRTKLYLRTNKNYLKHSIFVQDWAAEATNKLIQLYHTVLKKIPTDTKVFFVVIPHAVQTSRNYIQNYIDLGMSSANYMQNPYPFVQLLESEFKHIEIINPLEQFQALEAKGLKLYYANDPHLNQKGQFELYKIIKAHVAKEN